MSFKTPEASGCMSEWCLHPKTFAAYKKLSTYLVKTSPQRPELGVHVNVTGRRVEVMGRAHGERRPLDRVWIDDARIYR